MRFVVIHPKFEVRVDTWGGLRHVTYARLVTGDWIDDKGRRAGPALSNQLELLGEREVVRNELEQMARERPSA